MNTTREMNESEINLRRRYDLFLTNDWSRDTPRRPVYPSRPSFRGTPRQIMNEVAEFRRISGGCDIGYRVVDPGAGIEGAEYRLDDIDTAIMIADDV